MNFKFIRRISGDWISKIIVLCKILDVFGKQRSCDLATICHLNNTMKPHKMPVVDVAGFAPK